MTRLHSIFPGRCPFFCSRGKTCFRPGGPSPQPIGGSPADDTVYLVTKNGANAGGHSLGGGGSGTGDLGQPFCRPAIQAIKKIWPVADHASIQFTMALQST